MKGVVRFIKVLGSLQKQASRDNNGGSVCKCGSDGSSG